MPSDPGASRQKASPATTFCLALLLAGTSVPAAEFSPGVRQAVQAGIPRYDPAIREAHLAAQAAAAETAPPAPRPPAAPAPPPRPAPADDGVLVLDPITVWAIPDRKLPPRLPRPSALAPLRDLRGEPLESPGARDARLVRKHLSPAAQVLTRLLGNSPVVIARSAEEVLQRAQQLNGLADNIERGELLGQDPEVTRKLRVEYLRLYYKGPK